MNFKYRFGDNPKQLYYEGCAECVYFALVPLIMTNNHMQLDLLDFLLFYPCLCFCLSLSIDSTTYESNMKKVL